MRTSKFTPEQMGHILRQGDSDVPVVELCRQHGISEQTFSEHYFSSLAEAQIVLGIFRDDARASDLRARHARRSLSPGAAGASECAMGRARAPFRRDGERFRCAATWRSR